LIAYDTVIPALLVEETLALFQIVSINSSETDSFSSSVTVTITGQYVMQELRIGVEQCAPTSPNPPQPGRVLPMTVHEYSSESPVASSISEAWTDMFRGSTCPRIKSPVLCNSSELMVGGLLLRADVSLIASLTDVTKLDD
jgi:hypothetical protein